MLATVIKFLSEVTKVINQKFCSLANNI